MSRRSGVNSPHQRVQRAIPGAICGIRRSQQNGNSLMISRHTIALAAALMGATLFAPSAPAQVRGMHAFGPAPRARSSFRFSGRAGFGHPGQRRFYAGYAFLPPPYFYPDYYSGYGPETPEEPPAPMFAAQPPEPPLPVASPVEPLLMEYHGGQWMRIPTGSEMPVGPQSTQPESAQTSSPRPGIAGQEVRQQPPQLPPAVLVFRDGHQEEVEKYMIHGNVLYTSADYWSTGSWTRKILMADLDVPATLKLNEERGAKFDLPSGPGEIMVRF
jgi:hypothetical protein